MHTYKFFKYVFTVCTCTHKRPEYLIKYKHFQCSIEFVIYILLHYNNLHYFSMQEHEYTVPSYLTFSFSFSSDLIQWNIFSSCYFPFWISYGLCSYNKQYKGVKKGVNLILLVFLQFHIINISSKMYFWMLIALKFL